MGNHMDESEEPQKAIDRYRATEKGKAAQRRAQKNYTETEKGAAARRRASEKFESENAEARREYKRQKQAEYRAKRKQQVSTFKTETVEKSNPVISEAELSFPEGCSEGCIVQTPAGQIGQVIAVHYTVMFDDQSTQTFSRNELTAHFSDAAN
jgi:hypothetical protein